MPWRQIRKDNFTYLPALLNYLELPAEKILQKPHFPLNLPRRLASKIKKNCLDDPIFRQFVPLEEEAIVSPGFVKEPLQDQRFLKTKKILQKYKGRALILTTSACAMNCRFCFRQNFPYEKETRGFTEELAYLSQDKTLSEVILSGGDPLSLSNHSLYLLFRDLEALPHVRRIRFHTRFPIGIPERIDEDFLKLLVQSPKQIFFVIHCNHAKELDAEVISSLKKISHLGIPVLNQTVLLKGVNDEPEVMLQLCEALIDAGIIPYYLHELDPVEGMAHFASSRGGELIRYLQERLSGFGVPRLVREIPGERSKTIITSDRQF